MGNPFKAEESGAPDAFDQAVAAHQRRQMSPDGPPGEPSAVGLTWRPVDLHPILRGEHKLIEPDVGMARQDGLRLLYRGREHAIVGEMESGKSWLACAHAAAELNRDQRVVYVHFEEADPTDTVGRLRSLGVPDPLIGDLLAYVAPNEPVDPATLSQLLAPTPTLVILDGVNEAMALHGWKIMEPTGAAEYRRWLVRPFTSHGAAVVSLDHVPKDPAARGRNAIGSIHKGNGLDGALIVLENSAPFGRDKRGASYLFVTKDRPGFLRQHGNASRDGVTGKTYMGTLVVDDTRTHRNYLDLVLLPPSENEGERPDGKPAKGGDRADEDDRAVYGVVSAIGESGQPASGRQVRAKLPGIGKDRVLGALERLVLDGRLTETAGPKRARLFIPNEWADLDEEDDS